MRDTNQDMIELLYLPIIDNVYSAVIRCSIGGENLKLRFRIEQADYGRLKQIVEFRPFENTGVASYKYFFALSYQQDRDNKELTRTSVRVEQLNRHKQYEFTVSNKFLSNILWFNSLTEKNEVQQMIENEH